MVTKSFKSEALASVHEMMEGLHEAGSIDKRTMREFDAACLAGHHRLSGEPRGGRPPLSN
ncbi:MAG TPA: hypothetical protein VEZ20_11110 [Allosphingosinicella sp.]|jgi:putative transcriptional regulator|nr:hypothetical protein [Allosphingosinicella sp.]